MLLLTVVTFDVWKCVDQNDQRNSNLEKSYKCVDTCHLSTGGSCQCKKQTNKKKTKHTKCGIVFYLWFTLLHRSFILLLKTRKLCYEENTGFCLLN